MRIGLPIVCYAARDLCFLPHQCLCKWRIETLNDHRCSVYMFHLGACSDCNTRRSLPFAFCNFPTRLQRLCCCPLCRQTLPYAHQSISSPREFPPVNLLFIPPHFRTLRAFDASHRAEKKAKQRGFVKRTRGEVS